MLTLAEFRRATAHLAGERVLLCAGKEVRILWHDEVDAVSIDDGDPKLGGDAVVLQQSDSSAPSS